jgi:hypothetical protein
MYDAYKKDAENLCSYLRSPDCSLNPIQRRQLAELIDREINVKVGRGRKPGKRPLESELAAEFQNAITSQPGPSAHRLLQGKDNEATNTTFQYRGTSGNPRSRLAMYERWPHALFKAYSGKASDLCDYLCSYDFLLYKSQRHDLADLIHARIQHKGRLGRQRGPVRSPERFLGKITSDDVLARAIRIRESVREENDGRVPRDAIRIILRYAIISFVNDGYERPRDFACDAKVVLAALRRGKRSS